MEVKMLKKVVYGTLISVVAIGSTLFLVDSRVKMNAMESRYDQHDGWAHTDFTCDVLRDE